jgi:hypothetical protein
MKGDGGLTIFTPVLLCDVCSSILAYQTSEHDGTESRFFIHWAGQNICGECAGLFGWEPYPRMLDTIESQVPGDVLSVN